MTTPRQPTPGQEMTHREILVVLAGLLTGMFLVAVSQTSITTALPVIAGELGSVEQVAWIVTAYLLAATAATPLFGRISDVLGRTAVFKAAVGLFLVGSVMAALAPTMGVLVGARAVQGVGGGGVMALAMTIVGDILSPRERGRYQGYIGAMFGIATITGPLVGGFFVDHLDWRWVFWMNLPVGLVALVIITRVLHLPRQRIRQRIDYLGALLLVTGVSGLLLATSWGGTEYPWGSPTILGLLVGGGLLSALFVLRQHHAPNPLLPLRLFASRTFTLSAVGAFTVGAMVFGAMVFLPVFLQLVTGASATQAGVLLAPLMVGLVSTTVVTGRLITRTGRYKRYPIIGTALAAVAFVLMATMDETATRVEVGAYMAVLGVGLGMVMQNLILVAQNDAPASDLGVVTATVGFGRTLGGAVGTAVFGAVMATGLTSRLRGDLPPDQQVDPETVRGAPEAILALEPEVRDVVITAFADSISLVFVVAVPLAIVAFALMWLIPERPLRTTSHVAASRPDAGPSSTPEAAPPTGGMGPAPTPYPDLGRRRRRREADRDPGQRR